MDNITVDSLLQKAFCDLDLQLKMKVVLGGKPKPELNLLGVTSVDENGVMLVEHFNPAMYETVPWLTASEQLRTFYCWPCLLFIPKRNLWREDDFASLKNSVAAHEISPTHIQAEGLMKTFHYEHFNSKPQLDPLETRHLMKKNRDILKMLMDVVFHLVIKTRPPQGSRNQVQIKPETCVKLLKFLSNTIYEAADCGNEVIKLIQTHPQILNDLVYAMTKAMIAYFKKEIQSVRYVSIIISDHSAEVSNFQFSIILRYVLNGKVVERFVGFCNIVGEKTPEVIFNLLLHIIEEYGITEKFLSFSCDGAFFAETSELAEVNSMLERNHSNFYFVPCHFHGLYHILEQSLSINKELAFFFKMIKTMEEFLEKSSKQQKNLEIIILAAEPKLRSSKTWFEDTPFINLLFNYRKHFVELFDSIAQNFNKFSSEDIVNASGFSHFLKDVKNVFLIRVISVLFHNALPLDEAFRSPEPEKTFGTDTVAVILKENFALRQEFETFWEKTLEECNSNKGEKETKRFKTDVSLQMESLNKLYTHIVDRISQEIIIRYNNLVKLEFCCLLLPKGLQAESESNSKMSREHYLKLVQEFQSGFKINDLMTELDLLDKQARIPKNNLFEMLHCLENYKYKNVFKQVNELATFTLTMPFKPPSTNETYSKLEKIKKFAYYSVESLAPSFDISILNVESEFLTELKGDVFVCDEILARFCLVNKSLEILYDDL